jgi:transcriptional regulator with XRE-family HTH domain
VRRLTSLKKERQRRRLTQMELAEISGVNRTTITRLERGATRASPVTMSKLARALKVKPSALF